MKPFVKWVGGKRGIMKELISRLPENIENYHEAFVGGGALFFEIHDLRAPRHTFLNDINKDLITTYNVIKTHPQELIDLLKVHRDNHNKEYFYIMRSQHNLTSPIEIAARFIYLMKTCFNGMYRVNKKGEFNNPIGSLRNLNICDEETILSAHKAMKNTTATCGDFKSITPEKNDFVYFDPPYHVLRTTGGHAVDIKYYTSHFKEDKQIDLRYFALDLTKRGVNVMISNSNTSFIVKLYKDFYLHEIEAPRMFKNKCKVKELVITSYLP